MSILPEIVFVLHLSLRHKPIPFSSSAGKNLCWKCKKTVFWVELGDEKTSKCFLKDISTFWGKCTNIFRKMY